MRIDNFRIDQGGDPFVIAEISANHNNSLDEAMSLVKAAARAGANAVKFQTYTADTITMNSDTADFLIEEGPWKGKSLYSLYSDASMPWEWHYPLRDLAKAEGLSFLSSAFDETAVDFLHDLGVDAIKIASFEVTDLPLIRYACSTGLPVIISTGIANLAEINEALDWTAGQPSDVALMHCVSSYPAAPKDYYVKTISDLHERFGVPVGLSDHTTGIGTAAVAISQGAPIFEKHFTRNSQETGIDSFFSVDERALALYVKTLGEALEAFSGPNYDLKGDEVYNLKFRRSLYFTQDLPAGHILSRDDFRSVRPGYGLAPKHAAKLVGRALAQSVTVHSSVTEGVLEDK